MAYGTPTDPVAGAVITVAYAVANILDPIRALRANTGAADPPGSNYLVTSNSTSSTSWKTGASAIAGVLGYTPVNRAGDVMSGDLAVQNLNVANTSGDAAVGFRLDGFANALYIAATPSASAGTSLGFRTGPAGGTEADRLTIDANGIVHVHASAGGYTWRFSADANTLFISSSTSEGVLSIPRSLTGNLVFSGRRIWDENNDGPGSGLNADLLDGMHAADIIAAVPGAAVEVPAGVIAMWLTSMTAPAGWVVETNLYNVIAAGVNAAQNGTYGALGSTGGAASHGHDLSNHAHDYNHSHTVNAHAHTADHGHGASSGSNSAAGLSGGTGTSRADDPHTHPITVSATSGLATSSVGGATANLGASPVNTGAPSPNATSSASSLPPYKAVLYIRKS